jgi:transposase
MGGDRAASPAGAWPESAPRTQQSRDGERDALDPADGSTVAGPAALLPAVEERPHATVAVGEARGLAKRTGSADNRRRCGGLRDRRHNRSSASGRARGAKKGGQQIGRSRGGPSSKIHAVVDARGRPFCLAVTEGQRHDVVMAPFLLSRIRRAYVLADKGYDANELRAQLHRQRCRVVIPSNRTRRRRRRFDRKLYKRRHVVETSSSA